MRFAAVAVVGCLAFGIAGCGALERGAQNVLEELDDPAVITADAPFAGSPAERFGDGAGAITIPEARPVGRFSARDVNYAYRITKRILAATYLDRTTLLGGAPTAYAKALDPEQRKEFLWRLDHKDQKENSRSWVASFAKGEAELVGDVIKVKGSMSARRGKDENGDPELWINFEYRFVYPVRRPGTDKITRVMAYDKARVAFWRTAPGERLRHWVGESEDAWHAGVECKWDGYIHPIYPGVQSTGAPAEGPTRDPFAHTSSDGDGDCMNIGDV